MRLSLDIRARRLLRRIPQYSAYSIVEIALIALLAIQCARLFWAILTPVGPLGDWRIVDRTAGVAANRADIFRGFDPFFRLADGGTAVVTSLQLKLFGTRIDEVGGRGSAIIAGPDEVQSSYAVGDEIMPGVVLKAVAFDSVTIDRGGASEQLFIHQSTPAPAAASVAPVIGQPPNPSAPQPGGGAFTREQLRSGIGFAPRAEGGRVTGLVLNPNGDGAAFRGAGFQPGDILVAVNGQPITSAADAQRLIGGATPGANLSVSVERGAGMVPVMVSIAR